MRTTLDIDEDVLLAAREVARNRKTTAGKILSGWARAGYITQIPITRSKRGWPTLPVRPGAGPVTLELVNRLRDESP